MMRVKGVRVSVGIGAAMACLAGIAAAQGAGGAGGAGPSTLDTLLRVGGRTHPILVHFPIAMVLVAAMIETVRAIVRRPAPARTSIHMLGIGVIAAAAAIGSGWLNGEYENHASNADTMELHRWFGIGGGSVALLAYFFGLAASRSRRALMAFRALLLVAAGAIGFTGHLGGNMVYGEGYMLAPLKFGKRSATPTPTPTPTSTPPSTPTLTPAPTGTGVAATVVARPWDTTVNSLAGPSIVPGSAPVVVSIASVSFERDVLPIFIARCVECHGESKAKAGLRLDSLDHVRGAEPWVLSTDEPSDSDLLIRVKMNEQDDGAMPPKGERLSGAEIATIEAWIASLAMAAPAAVLEGGAEPSASRDPTRQQAKAGNAETPDSDAGAWTDVQMEAIRALRAKGASVEPVSADSVMLDVNLSLMSPVCDGQTFSMLGPVVGRVERLNLAGASVGNADLAVLDGGGAIRSIDLARTRVDDVGAAILAGLPALETLIVTGTGVTDAGVRTLAGSRSLRSVYAAGTKVTAAGAASVGERMRVVLGAPERPTRVYLVRHAEKQSEGEDPGLTEQGGKRAQALMTELAAEPIRVVYVTQFARTQQTAQPLTEKLGLTPVVMQASRDVAAHAAEIAGAIRALGPGQTAVVAGHSNTIPEIIKALGVPETVEIDDSRYGDLFVVELGTGGADGVRLVETRRFGD